MDTDVKEDAEAIEQRLRLHVDRLAGLIGPRNLSRPRSIQATLGYLRGQWDEIGFEVVEENYFALGREATNLIVERQGSRKPEEIVLLGAHYDTCFETPGADDNASAVAVMLEVSRLLQAHIGRRTVRYVAFACEEPPYFNLDKTGPMGSQEHARRARERGDDIVAMLCLEMLGYYSDEPGSQQIPEEIPPMLKRCLPTRGDFLAAVGNLQSWRLLWPVRRGFKKACRLPLFTIALPESVTAIQLSDNHSFWDYDYPALMVTDTSFLRNPNYHTLSDTPETLDYARMTKATLGIAGAMRRLLR